MITEKSESLIQEYREALLNLDKPLCVQVALNALSARIATVPELYQDVLAPALKDICEAEMDQPDSILKEHIRSEITRTVIECCYPYVIKEAQFRKENSDSVSPLTSENNKVMIVLPSDEHHNLGARMGADFFQIAGFEAIFLGTETPRDVILSGLISFKPRYIVIHVVNYYNLFKVKDLLNQIRNYAPEVKVLASGSAFYDCHAHLNSLGPLCLIRTFQDVASLTEDVL